MIYQLLSYFDMEFLFSDPWSTDQSSVTADKESKGAGPHYAHVPVSGFRGELRGRDCY